MKLDIEKFKSLKKSTVEKAMRPELMGGVGSLVVNVISIAIGVFVSYYMYARVGIVDPFSLVVFILGIMLGVIGFERFFGGVADIIVLFQDKARYLKGEYCTRFATLARILGVDSDITELSVNLVDEGLELSYMASTYMAGRYQCTVPWGSVYRVFINRKEDCVCIFFREPEMLVDNDSHVINSYPWGGVVVSGLFSGYSMDTVEPYIRSKVDSELIIERDVTAEEQDRYLFRVNMVLAACAVVKEQKVEVVSGEDTTSEDKVVEEVNGSESSKVEEATVETSEELETTESANPSEESESEEGADGNESTEESMPEKPSEGSEPAEDKFEEEATMDMEEEEATKPLDECSSPESEKK